MSSSPTMEITDIPPLLQQTATPDTSRRRVVQFGIGATLVVSLQLAAITWLVPPWQQSGLTAATQVGVPHILISEGDESVTDARLSDAGTKGARATELATGPSSDAREYIDQPSQSADLSRAATPTRSLVSGTAIADGLPNDDAGSAEEQGVGDTRAQTNKAVALALNEALPEIAPIPAPPARDVAFYPRPQVRPAHLLAERPASRVRITAPVQKAKTTTATGPESDWLANQSRRHFTLQMVSVSDGARFL